MTEVAKRGESSESAGADVSRRSFFLKLGAGVSTAVASAAVGAKSLESDDASLRAALLEEERAVRDLHRAFEEALDRGRYDEVVEMFADDARVVFNGGIFDERTGGVSRLYRERFRFTRSGRRIEPAPGFELDPDKRQEKVEISVDRLTAEAVFPYSIQVGKPIETETSLASMAGLHGGAVQTWWEGGVYRVRYCKDAVDGRWKIGSLAYATLARADYRPGRTYATSIAVAPIDTRFPEDPLGPDALIGRG